MKPVQLLGVQIETLDGLQHYLAQVGMQSRCAQSVASVDGSSAVVFFPDEFAPAEVNRVVAAVLNRKEPRRLIVVSANAPRFERLLAGVGAAATHARVLPKPAFGWVIADALRAGDERP